MAVAVLVVKAADGREMDWCAGYAACSGDRVTSPRPARRPATEMSSSSASQCRPRRPNSTCSRWAGVACNRRGNHASGTPSVRPSDSSTHIVSVSKRTVVAEMVMPGFQEKIAVVFDHAKDIRKFPGIEAETVGNGDVSFKPHFRVAATTPDVDMRRLRRLPLVGKEIVA